MRSLNRSDKQQLIITGLFMWIWALTIIAPCQADQPEKANTEYYQANLILWNEPLIDLEFVWLKGDCFQMGQSLREKNTLTDEAGELKYRDFYSDELPQHKVCIDDFWLARNEITRLQWKQLMATEPFSADLPEDHPATNISWLKAMDFILVLNGISNQTFRLPTEAEMEYAIRAGTETPFNTGQTISTEQANYNGNHTYGPGYKGVYLEKTTPVRSYSSNQYGLFDMHGNVWEWSSDWYDKEYYRNSPVDNPQGPETGEKKVMRGGSWFTAPRSVRSANRRGLEPDVGLEDSGFRIVVMRPTPKQPPEPSAEEKTDGFDPDF